MLCSLLAHVVPRSLEGLDDDQFIQSMIGKQAKNLEKSIGKLTGKTMFETEGWKRIPGCFFFMESFGLNPEHFELVAEKVIHPNSRGFDRFISDLQNDPHSTLHPQLATQSVDSSLRTFIDAVNSGDNVVVQQNKIPTEQNSTEQNSAMGHVVVIVGHDPNTKEFKVK